MSVKLSGAEMNAFMVDPAVWGEEGNWSGRWYDDAYVEVDGEQDDLEYTFRSDDSKLPADAKVTVEGGCLYRGEDANSPWDDFEKFLRRWLKARSVTTLVLEVPNEQVEAIRGLLEARGVRVLPSPSRLSSQGQGS